MTNHNKEILKVGIIFHRRSLLFKLLTLFLIKVKKNSLSLNVSLTLTEQVGQEILANLHSDREKIQRARERVGTHTHTCHLRTLICLF